MSNSLWPHESQHARPPCLSPTPKVHSDSRPLSQWCHPAISSSVVPFSSCLQSFPASGSYLVSQFFTSGGQNIGASASASVLPVTIQEKCRRSQNGCFELSRKQAWPHDLKLWRENCWPEAPTHSSENAVVNNCPKKRGFQAECVVTRGLWSVG